MTRSLGEFYTLLLVFFAFVGSRLLQIGLGEFHITPYRLLCLIGLFLIPFNKNGINSKRSIYAYILLLIFWIVYSLFFYIISTPDKEAYWQLLFFLLCGTITTYYIGVYVTDFRTLKKCFLTITFASIFPFYFAIYEIISGNYLFVDQINAYLYSVDSSEWSSFGVRVPISTFSNPNDFAFMVLVVVISSYISIKLTKGVSRFFVFILFVVSLLLILATQSRAAFISLVICFGIVTIFRFPTLESSRKRLCISLLPLLVVFLAYIYIAYQDVLEPLLTIDVEGGSSDVIRSNLIKNGLLFLESSYYMGVGLGNIEYHMIHHAVFNTREYLSIHNWWMEILVSSGIIVFIWYVTLYIKLVINIFKKVRKKQDSNMMFVYLMSFAYLIIFIIDSMSSSCLAKIECSWVIMALMFIVSSITPNYMVAENK